MMNIASILADFAVAQPAQTAQVSNGPKGTPLVEELVTYVANNGRKAQHFKASVNMGKGQWTKDVDLAGNETLSSKPTLLIQVYPASQQEVTHPTVKDGKATTMQVKPCKVIKEKLATICKAICSAKFTLSEYSEKGAKECADLCNVMKELSEMGVAVDKDLKKFSMKTFYLLPNDDGTYYLKAKGFNPNRR